MNKYSTTVLIEVGIQPQIAVSLTAMWGRQMILGELRSPGQGGAFTGPGAEIAFFFAVHKSFSAWIHAGVGENLLQTEELRGVPAWIHAEPTFPPRGPASFPDFIVAHEGLEDGVRERVKRGVWGLFCGGWRKFGSAVTRVPESQKQLAQDPDGIESQRAVGGSPAVGTREPCELRTPPADSSKGDVM